MQLSLMATMLWQRVMMMVVLSFSSCTDTFCDLCVCRQLSSLSAAMGAPRRSNFLVAATLQSFVTPHKVSLQHSHAL